MIYSNKCLRVFVLLLTSLSLVKAMEIEKKSLFVPARLGDISIIHDQNEFHVTSEGETTTVKSWLIDKELRGISQDKLVRLLAADAYLQVNKSSNSDYTLTLQQRIRGGGALGAWLGSAAGYFAVSVAGHGAIHLVALTTGPFYIPVSTTLNKMCAVPIHSAACAAGVAAGMAGGVATGPV